MSVVKISHQLGNETMVTRPGDPALGQHYWSRQKCKFSTHIGITAFIEPVVLHTPGDNAARPETPTFSMTVPAPCSYYCHC